MNKLSTLTLIALTIATLIIAALPTKVEAAPVTVATTTTVIVTSTDETAGTPALIGTSHTTSNVKASIAPVHTERVRKVAHTNEVTSTDIPADPYAGWTYTVFEDGSWILDQDGLPNTQDGIYVTWDQTGCIAGGTCNE